MRSALGGSHSAAVPRGRAVRRPRPASCRTARRARTDPRCRRRRGADRRSGTTTRSSDDVGLVVLPRRVPERRAAFDVLPEVEPRMVLPEARRARGRGTTGTRAPGSRRRDCEVGEREALALGPEHRRSASKPASAPGLRSDARTCDIERPRRSTSTSMSTGPWRTWPANTPLRLRNGCVESPSAASIARAAVAATMPPWGTIGQFQCVAEVA